MDEGNGLVAIPRNGGDVGISNPSQDTKHMQMGIVLEQSDDLGSINNGNLAKSMPENSSMLEDDLNRILSLTK